MFQGFSILTLSQMDDDLYYLVALSLVEGIGSVSAKRLISMFSTAQDVFRAKVSELVKVDGVGLQTAKEITSKSVFSRADIELKFIEKNSIRVWCYTDHEFPFRLKDCPDSPFILFGKGVCPFNAEKSLSIVGTRRVSSYGARILDDFITQLVPENIVIVSGMAIGVDTLAHRNVIQHQGSTIGILGHGLHMIYPSLNRSLAEATLEKGGLITEYPSQSKIMPGHFPRRNRIIAGISDATLIIESGVKGGAMISANYAHAYNRTVLAIPGSIYSMQSEGCHQLIQTSKASLVHSPEHLLQLLSWNKGGKIKPVQTQMFQELNPEEEAVLHILRENPQIHIDLLDFKTKSLPCKLPEILLNLELYGLIISLPGKRFRAIQ